MRTMPIIPLLHVYGMAKFLLPHPPQNSTEMHIAALSLVQFPSRYIHLNNRQNPYQIGKGDNGVVYKVHDKKGREFAFKHNYCEFNDPSSCSSSNTCEIIQNEHAFLKQMKNPYLVNVYQRLDLKPTVATDHTKYCGFVMEYCKSLEYNVGNMKYSVARKLANNILRGLILLHMKHYYHGDIATRNIVYCSKKDTYKMIDPIGKKLQQDDPKLLEFQSRDLWMLGATLYGFYNYEFGNYVDEEWFKSMSYYKTKLIELGQNFEVSDTVTTREKKEYDELIFKHFVAKLKDKSANEDVQGMLEHPFLTGMNAEFR